MLLGRERLSELAPTSASFASLELEVTRLLLDSAIGAAQRLPMPALARPELSEARWALRLAGYFHTTNATSRLMPVAARRFQEAGKTELARWAEQKTKDERGHDDLALRDLQDLGFDARALVDAIVPETAKKLVAFFEETVLRDELPTRSVGYAYALERLASTRTRQDVRAIEAMLPKGKNATRCLHVHSGVGSDVDHVEDIVRLVSDLPHQEREIITRAAYETTRLGRSTTTPTLSEQELVRLLAPFRKCAVET